VEVGLGGRLDSTNIITPVLSIITNISYDHMQLLGDTLENIAIEKAGIIKSGIPVIIGETQDEVSNIFIEKAKSTGSEIVFADACYSAIRNPQHYDIHHSGNIFIRQLESPLLGNYQRKNIVTVIGACEILTKTGIEIDTDCIRKGIRNVIRNTELAGRWQILSLDPLTICDTGHNEAGLREVLAQIQTIPHKQLHFVFGVVNDKEIGKILELMPKNAIYYFCKADIPRGLSQNELKKQANAAGLSGNAYPSVRQALRKAQKDASTNDLVFVGGSTFVVAEVV
jgi:dihydrofolate synthase/folylpolyglutamate synthase